MSHQDDVFFRTFFIVLGALAAFAALFFIIAQMFSGEPEGDGRAKDARVQNALEERIKPVGRVSIGGAEVETQAPPADAVVAERSGKEIVTASCASCHATGVVGAPKIGDQAGWEGRLANGLDSLLHNAINGLNAMPARGGNAALSDDEVKRAIVSMLEDSGLDATASASPASETTSTDESAEPAQAVADDEPAEVDLEHGKSVYSRACFACHGTGAAGAPKVGDPASWSERIAKGLDTLVQGAISGFQGRQGYMPPKGGHPYLSDGDIHASVAYMVSVSQ